MDEEVKLPTFSALTDNEVDEQRVEEWDRQRKEQDRENYFINKSNVGKKFLDKHLSDYITDTDEKKNILTTVNQFIKDVNDGKCRTLWLCGSTGTGKTLLGSCICRETMGTFARTT